MLVLPLERIFKPTKPWNRGVADDRDLDPALADLVNQDLGAERNFGHAAFFEPDEWAYVSEIEPFDVGRNWPRHALDRLRNPEAHLSAAEAPASEVLLALRNALAHGGFTYLDLNGGHTDFQTSMLGFASFVSQRSEKLRLLRVTVSGFETFLSLWVAWLSSSGVLDQLEKLGPGYFGRAA